MNIDNKIKELEFQIEMLQREKRKVNEPQMVENPDWTSVREMTVEYLQSLCNESNIDDDFQQYLFEEVFTTLYGKDVWKYINSLMM